MIPDSEYYYLYNSHEGKRVLDDIIDSICGFYNIGPPEEMYNQMLIESLHKRKILPEEAAFAPLTDTVYVRDAVARGIAARILDRIESGRKEAEAENV